MNEHALTEESMGYFVEGDPQYPQIIGIDDLLYIVIVAGISGAVSWMVQRCLNHEFNAEKVRRLVRWSCYKKAAVTPEAGQLGLDGEKIDRLYGDRMVFAITKTHDRVRPALICGATPGEPPMPEGLDVACHPM